MKIWMMVAVVGMLAMASFAVVNAFSSEKVVEDTTDVAPSCGGGCSAGNTCGSASCGFVETGSCECGR
jgi:hypothetical protein